MPIDTSKPKAKAATPVLSPEERFERDAARYEDLAREHGADLGEEGFNEALKRVARRTADPAAPPKD